MGEQHNLYTLVEASRLTGLSTEALRLRIKRGRLASEKGNDGQPRVRLTNADLETFQQRHARSDRDESTLARQNLAATNNSRILEDAFNLLREQLAKVEAQASAERSRADQAERERAELREREVRLDGEATRLRDALQLAEAQIQTASRRAEQAQHELTAARQQEVEAVKRVANLEGELDGVKHGMEHLQDLAAQSRREVEEAQRRATEASEQAQKAHRATLEAMQELERLRERGWWKRLRGQ